MENTIKLEIVAANAHINKIVELLENAEIYAYSVMNIERGSGNKSGEVRKTGVTGVSNVYFLIICTIEQKDKAIKLLAPFLKIAGGICFYSDITFINTL